MKKIVIFVIAAIILCLIVLYQSLKVESIYARCSDFKTQQEAQKALQKGQTQLDRDKDGVACESLPLKEK